MPRRQFCGGCHRRSRREGAQSPALPPPVNEEPPQQPSSVVIGPAGQPGSACLQRQHPNRLTCRFDHIRPPGLFRQTGQCHAQRVANKDELPRGQFQERDGPQLDGARIRFQVVQGDQPDGAVCSSQLAGASMFPACPASAGGPAGSIHMTSQR